VIRLEGCIRSVRCSRMWIAKRYTFWTEHLHCNYSRGHCKHIDTEHSVNIVHAVGIMQHAKLHNGIILCPARENHSGKCSYFLLRVFFKSVCMAQIWLKDIDFSLLSINQNFITRYMDITQKITENALLFTAFAVIAWPVLNIRGNTPFLYHIFLKICCM